LGGDAKGAKSSIKDYHFCHSFQLLPIAPVAYRLSSTPPTTYIPLTLALKVRLIVKIVSITLFNKIIVALKVDEVLILEVERVVKFCRHLDEARKEKNDKRNERAHSSWYYANLRWRLNGNEPEEGYLDDGELEVRHVSSSRRGRCWLLHLARLTSPEQQLPILDSSLCNEDTRYYNGNTEYKYLSKECCSNPSQLLQAIPYLIYIVECSAYHLSTLARRRDL
jgi:hypothetical protein